MEKETVENTLSRIWLRLEKIEMDLRSINSQNFLTLIDQNEIFNKFMHEVRNFINKKEGLRKKKQ